MSFPERPVKRKRSQSPDIKSLFDIPAWNSTTPQSDVPATSHHDVTTTSNLDLGQSSIRTPAVMHVAPAAALHHTPSTTVHALHIPTSATERMHQQLTRSNPATAIFTVFVGTPERRYDLKKSVLCESSVLFKTLISRNINLGWYKLPLGNFRAWDLFALWLDNRNILNPPAENPDELPPSLHQLIILYDLAFDFQVGALVSSVIATICRRLALDSEPVTIVEETIRFLLKRKKFVSPIREILVGWLASAAPWNEKNVDLIWKLPSPLPHEVFTLIGQLAPRERQQWAQRNINHYSTVAFNF